jgi:hypothetical protein
MTERDERRISPDAPEPPDTPEPPDLDVDVTQFLDEDEREAPRRARGDQDEPPD